MCACACGAGSRATVVEVAPQELPAPVVTASAAPVVSPQSLPTRLATCEPPLETRQCVEVARVRVGAIALSSPTCVVDLVVKEGDVGHVMKCPEGAFVAFDHGRFGGTYDGIVLDSCTTTTYPFSDGCTWETTQRIVGRADTSMRFSYHERAVAGKNCSPAACTATADLFTVP